MSRVLLAKKPCCTLWGSRSRFAGPNIYTSLRGTSVIETSIVTTRLVVSLFHCQATRIMEIAKAYENNPMPQYWNRMVYYTGTSSVDGEGWPTYLFWRFMPDLLFAVRPLLRFEHETSSRFVEPGTMVYAQQCWRFLPPVPPFLSSSFNVRS